MKKATVIKQLVKNSYEKIAKQAACDCGGCGCGKNQQLQRQTKELGYSDEEMSAAPFGSNLGLGCGNPVAIASLKPGEVVLDLGSGAGFDAFIAANKVGPTGKVIGVDISQAMLTKANEKAKQHGYTQVEFLEGEIEHLPLPEHSVDVVISNCVINLSPDKEKVFTEIYRVLKPGGRLMVSDTVLLKPLPDELKDNEELLTGCVSGAMLKDDYLSLINRVHFKNVTVHKETPGFLEGYSQSLTYSAVK